MKLLALSPKAKQTLALKMANCPEVEVRQRNGRKVLVSSVKGPFCAWIDLAKDPDWLLVL